MQPVRTDPPHIPLRTAGWPTRRSPRWAIAAGAALLAVGVAVGLAHRPTPGQRATDLRSFLQALNSDVESCSGGVRDSLFVLREIDSGASHDVKTAITVASTAAANCSPANNELLDNLTAEQVPESLSSYHLQAAVADLIGWAAPDAATTAADVAAVLAARGKPAEAAARAALRLALRRLDAQRAVADAALEPAIKALSPQSSPPRLYG
jgi:hypothetical protein